MGKPTSGMADVAADQNLSGGHISLPCTIVPVQPHLFSVWHRGDTEAWPIQGWVPDAATFPLLPPMGWQRIRSGPLTIVKDDF